MNEVAGAISEVQNFVGGKLKSSQSRKIDVLSPLTGETIAEVPLSTYTELDEAVQSAQKAFKFWSGLSFHFWRMDLQRPEK